MQLSGFSQLFLCTQFLLCSLARLTSLKEEASTLQ